MKHRNRQRPHRGNPRHGMSTYTEVIISKAIDREASRYKVSRSFVIAVACAYALGIELDVKDTYKPVAVPLRLVRKRA